MRWNLRIKSWNSRNPLERAWLSGLVLVTAGLLMHLLVFAVPTLVIMAASLLGVPPVPRHILAVAAMILWNMGIGTMITDKGRKDEPPRARIVDAKAFVDAIKGKAEEDDG